MSEIEQAPNVTETIQFPIAEKLPPKIEILSIHPVDPGWCSYYLDEANSRVVSAPIAMWALVDYPDGVHTTPDDEDEIIYKQEIRPFIVALSGNVIDYRELPYVVLCVIGPSITDHITYVKDQLELRGITDADLTRIQN
jgi:hypothetical protein